MDDGAGSRADVMKMYQFIYGNWFTMITYVYAELDIASLLRAAPRSVAELAALTQTDEKALARLLRCAGVMGFHTTDAETGKLSPTDLGLLLCAASPHSLRAAARLNGAPYRYQPWSHLLEYVKLGTGSGLSPTWDEGSLEYLKDKPDLLAAFQEAMTDLGKSVYGSANEDELIAESVDFSRFRRVIDVGCGNGTLLEAVLLKNRTLRGALFDLAEVLERVAPCPADHPNAGRVEKVAGDFRESVPAGYDAYLMKNVIHNWPRHKCQTLLENIRRAILRESPDGLRPEERRLLMFEMVMPDCGEENLISNLVNLNMNLLVDGTVGTLGDYESLLGDCGFRILCVGELPGLERKVIEAAAVA